jgi:hypothetical protein
MAKRVKLLNRRHDGCDDMCGECVEWMSRVFELTKPVAQEAMKAFWNVVAARLPECAPNDPDAHTAELFADAAEEAVGHWAVENLPKPELKVTADGRPVRKVLRFEPASNEAQPDALFLPFK